MTGSAKQSIAETKLDCFVAALLAMTDVEAYTDTA